MPQQAKKTWRSRSILLLIEKGSKEEFRSDLRPSSQLLHKWAFSPKSESIFQANPNSGRVELDSAEDIGSNLEIVRDHFEAIGFTKEYLPGGVRNGMLEMNKSTAKACFGPEIRSNIELE
ncbi:hypothetical protein L596_013507 [Steinernema carpocapsae]|uniref:Uncharacterized protein n=1 Tax=Steinernema carpocapsae TaxID=34508 RepID=A0A4U5P0D1_STECR|nr:hypothetical protein L596_013507 [Steinernema carpocapsae]